MKRLIFSGLFIFNSLLAHEGSFPIDFDQKHLFSSSIKESLKEAYIQKTKRQCFWSENYYKASKISKEKQKFLLLAFVGSDWCPWSQKLETEVLTQAGFTKPLKEDLVFVWVDFPENAKVPLERQETNQYLKEKYHVGELPTLVLVDDTGQQVCAIGYLPLDAEGFARHFLELMTEYKKIKMILETSNLASFSENELESLYLKAKQIGCQKFLDEIMQAGLKSDRGTFFLLERYEDLLGEEKTKEPEVLEIHKTIKARDPANLNGTQLKLAIIQFQRILNHPNKRDKPHAAIEPLIEYIREFGRKDTENAWRVEMMIAEYFFSKGIVGQALHYAASSFDSAPECAKAEIAQSIDYLKTQQISE